ncbi:MAG TPA: type II secretion system minor pseudopilin GspI [Gammaproteobacteria bacterium]|nr:type II secretion system minor pseudopilin GspI [Gammaproteobacteria bacterium]
MNRTARQRGFTLLEVLVALAIVATALAALVRAGSDNAATAAYLRDKSLAEWVALNRIAELRLQEEWPSPGTREGEARMADRTWAWTVEVSETFDPDVRRADVTVRAAGTGDGPEGAAVRRAAFLGRPQPEAGQ